MLTFSFPANYTRYVQSELAIILAKIGRDVHCRADEDPRVRALADVPDALYEAPREGAPVGTATILIVETVPLVAVTQGEVPDITSETVHLPDHLHAMSTRASA